MTDDNISIETKQKYLRDNIIDKVFNPIDFTSFMCEEKGIFKR